MAGFTCPFCTKTMVDNRDTHQQRFPSFDREDDSDGARTEAGYDQDTIIIDFYRCPDCGESSIRLTGVGFQVVDSNTWFRPNSMAKQFPDYIPEGIRNDYQEACAIVNTSPKASATLSRRCLQGMIRDYWGVSGKPNLYQEIESIKDKVQPTQWKVIHAVRNLGNIGAHMQRDINVIIDIDPGEAEKLIQLIELLMNDWYIRRHEQEQLFDDIAAIDESKQEQRP